MSDSGKLRVSLAQISPVWLDRTATLEKVENYISQAADQGSQFVIPQATIQDRISPTYIATAPVNQP